MPTNRTARATRRLLFGNIAIVLGGIIAAVSLIVFVVGPIQPWAHKLKPANDSISARPPEAPHSEAAQPLAQTSLPPEEIAKFQFEETAVADPLSFYLSNQSGWMIFGFIVRVTVRNADGTVAYSRTVAMGDQGIEVYEMPPTVGDGLQRMWISGGISSPLLQAGQTLSRTLIAATGYAATPQFMDQYDRANGYTEHRDPQTGMRIMFDLRTRQWVNAKK